MQLLKPAPRIDAFVFDMDGTLIDSMPDLITVTNATMEHFGYPTHTPDEILHMVGNGLRSLIAQALPQNLEEAQLEEGIAYWKGLYDVRGNQQTTVYDGMLDTLAQLKAQGKKLAVVSNKYDRGVKLMTREYFDDLMDFAIGDGPVPRKPDPQGLLRVSDELGIAPEHIAYIGDSDVDMQVANNAGAYPIGCTWGYMPTEALLANSPGALIDAPAELLELA